VLGGLGSCLLISQIWDPCFDPHQEVMKMTLIWENLLGSPLEIWNDKFPWDIENYLGRTLLIDLSYKYSVH
jgi:hypothetical protein